MGYTHYWKYTPSKIEDTEELRKIFRRCIKQVKRIQRILCKHNDVLKICGGLGEGKPIINESEIWFNGDRSRDEDHETFRIYWGEDSDGFCKTARKPYDLMVCVTLMTFAHYFPANVFSFSSDGNLGEITWKNAVFYYETITGNVARVAHLSTEQDKI